MALTISTGEGLVTAEHGKDGIELTVTGSRATLTAKDAALLAKYLTEWGGEEVEPEPDEE